MSWSLLYQKSLEGINREVEVFEGFNGIKSVMERTLKLSKKGDELLILGASKFSTSQFENYLENYYKKWLIQELYAGI